jgi:hypothetical protein
MGSSPLLRYLIFEIKIELTPEIRSLFSTHYLNNILIKKKYRDLDQKLPQKSPLKKLQKI